jgi:iron complex outermembrane receptor protein
LRRRPIRVNRRSGVIPSAALALLTALAVTTFSTDIAGQAPQSVQPPSELKRLSLDELQRIEVTSVSRRPEPLAQTASAIQVVTAEDIRRSGATSLPEALKLASNLEVAQVDSRQWAISARGFNSTSANKLLVLIDGRVVYTPLYSGVFWEVQDTLLEDIDRIEVISGPGAALWGATAVNGVINITTKRSKDTQGLLVTGGGGSELNGAGGVRYGRALGADTHVRAYAKYFDRDPSALPNGQPAIDDWHMGQGGFRLDSTIADVHTFTVQGDTYKGSVAQPGTDPIEVSGSNVLGRWVRAFSQSSDLSLQLFYDRTHRDLPGAFGEVLSTYDADFQHRFQARGRQDVVWGLGYRASVDDVSNSAMLAFLPPHVTRQWFSGFVQDEVPALHDRLHVTLGTRIEHNPYTGVEIQPSGRLRWTLTERHMLWGAVSRAVRTPSRIDRELFAPANPPFLLAGGPDFRSETLAAYELGYRGDLGGRVLVSIATFANRYDQIRSLEPLHPPAPIPIVIGNGLAGTSRGAEVTGDYRVTDWWRIQPGYTALHLDLHPKPGSLDRTFGSSESQTPNQQAFLRQSFDLPRNVQLDAGFRHVSRIRDQSVPAYQELDGRLAWQFSSTLDFSIAGRNLLHRRHAEFGAAATRREVERSVYGQLVWRSRKS